MSNKFIYLGGLIDGVNLGQAKVWRELATQRLEQAGIRTLDPTRKIHQKFIKLTRMMDMDYNRLEDSAKQIVKKDMAMIRDADVLLCNLARVTSLSVREGPVGSLMELFFASYVVDIPTIVVCEDRQYMKRPWIKEHTTKCLPTLDRALKYLIRNYS